MSIPHMTISWSGATIIGTAGIAGMVLGGLICWVCDRIAARIRQIRQQRRTLASLRPRRTVELAGTHRSK